MLQIENNAPREWPLLMARVGAGEKLLYDFRKIFATICLSLMRFMSPQEHRKKFIRPLSYVVLKGAAKKLQLTFSQLET